MKNKIKNIAINFISIIIFIYLSPVIFLLLLVAGDKIIKGFMAFFVEFYKESKQLTEEELIKEVEKIIKEDNENRTN